MKKIFIDVNVLLDVALERTPFVISSQNLLIAVEKRQVRGAVSALTCSILYYLIQQERNHKIAMKYVRHLMALFDVAALTRDILSRALELNLNDFEDGIQGACAESCQADYLITRNAKDFSGVIVPVLSPSEYLTLSSM